MSFLDGAPSLSLDPALEPCQRHLRSLVNALESTCKIHEPKSFARRPRRRGPRDRDSEYHPECFQDLQNMTCAESARDILLYGRELVKAMQVPAELVWNYHLPEGRKFRKENWKTYRLVQKLFFLKSWLRTVAAPAKHAILWSGFWTDPEEGGWRGTSNISRYAVFDRREVCFQVSSLTSAFPSLEPPTGGPRWAHFQREPFCIRKPHRARHAPS